jgi:HK97 family phage major capsid protein
MPATKTDPQELIGKRQVRTFAIDGDQAKRATSIDEEARTVELAFASEVKVERWFGTEILLCGAENVMLDRLNAGGALLCNHETDEQIGVVVRGSARTDPDRVCRATVKFSQRQAGLDEFQDVKDGIRSLVSTGYLIHEYTVDEDTETYTATRWEPLEVSLVSIAADIEGAGVDRGLDAGGIDRPPTANEIAKFKARAQALGLKVVDKEGAQPMANDDKEKQERERIAELPPAPPPEQRASAGAVVLASEIMELAKVIDAPGETLAQELARDAIAEGNTLAEFRQKVFEKRREREAATKTPVAKTGNVIDLTEREKKQFSIRNAILADYNMRMGQKDQECFELEISNEIEKRLGAIHSGYTRHGGVLIPTGIALRGGAEMQERRLAAQQVRAGLAAKTTGSGKELVFTEFGSFIELLRSKAMVIALGATVLPGLQGNVGFPRQIGAGTLTWGVENPGADVAESNLTLDQVVLSPKTAQSTTSYSRQLLAQSAIDVDGLVMDDLAAINALGIDKAAIDGVAPAPVGIYTASGVNSVAFGGTVTFDHLVQMETEVASDNADVGTMAYLCTPQVRGKAKVTPELIGTGFSQPIWRDGQVNGYRAEVTNQLAKNLGVATNEHEIIFGVWAQLLIGEWGVLEIITDPYAKKKQGMLEVTSFLLADVQPRHGESFCKGTGLIP